MAGTVSADIQQSMGSTAVFYSLLIPAILLWFTYWRLSRRRLYELAEKLPGPQGFLLAQESFHQIVFKLTYRIPAYWKRSRFDWYIAQ